MGMCYDLYAEARVDGQWVGIDFYVRTEDGWLPVPLASGQSAVGSALDWFGNEMQISAADLSAELKHDHPWYQEQETEGWKGSLITAIEGKAFAPYDFSKPEHCGFVDCESILLYERDGVDIEEWLTGKELAELPPEARQGYRWYEWSERGGDVEVMRDIYKALLHRIHAYNDITAFTRHGAYREIDIADCRVVVFKS